MEKYSSGLVSESFWFVECKKIIKLLHDGNSWENIKKMCLEENLFEVSNEYRGRRMFGYIKSRIETLDNKEIDIFINGDISTQKTIIIIAIAKKNRLFYEFLYEVYRENIMIGLCEISNSDISIFFKDKQGQNEEIESWTDKTLKRLRSTYINFLNNSGMLIVNSKVNKLIPPIIDKNLELHMKNKGDTKLFNAITGVR